MMRVSRYIFLILTLVICLVAVPVEISASNFKANLVSGFSYSHLEPGLPASVAGEMEMDSYTYLCLELPGYLGQYQYDLKIKGDFADSSLEVEEALISGLAGPTLFDLGKGRRVWGKGYAFSPTYPLLDQPYWGTEWKAIVNSFNLSGGAVLDENLEKVESGWFKVGSFWGTSDYTAVISILDQEKRYYNLGANFSHDFLNGFGVRGGINCRQTNSFEEVEFQYLLGGDYALKNNNTLVLEYYRDEEPHLLVALQHMAIFDKWSWQVRDLINMSDYGEIRTFTLDYLANDDITPSLTLEQFVGSEDSHMGSNPVDWKISLEMDIKLDI